MSDRTWDAGTGRIAWLTIVLVAMGGAVIAVAMLRGQQPTGVDLGPGQLHVDFAAGAGGGLTTEEIQQEQAAMRDRVERLEADARASGAADPITDVDLSGRWTGANGFTYVIQQVGRQAVIQELSGTLVTAVGEGSVYGQKVHFDAQAVNGVSTSVDLALDGPDVLRGTFTNAYFGTAPATMTRGL